MAGHINPDAETLDFDPHQLQAMHQWCVKFRELVRRGGTPAEADCERFMRFQVVCYAEGVANV